MQTGLARGRLFAATAMTFLALVLSGCIQKQPLDVIAVDPEELTAVSTTLNSTVESLTKLVQARKNGLTIEMFAFKPHSSGVEEYTIGLEDGTMVSLVDSIRAVNSFIPILSVAEEGGDYYWQLNDEWLLSSQQDKVRVLDLSLTPHFLCTSTGLGYSLGDSGNIVSITDSRLHSAAIVSVDYNSDNNSLSFRLPSEASLEIPLRDKSAVLQQNVQNEVYYKDVFLDAGAGLTSRKTLYAAQSLGLSLEGISFARSASNPEEIELQHSVVAGSEEDENGRLLYPDGQPRYKLLFVNGGSSKTHGKSLGEDGIARMQEFVANGGSYVGTCAGAFFASSGYDSNVDYPAYLHLWPGVTTHTGISNGATDMTIEEGSPLLDYYDFGGDLLVSNVRHNGGGFPASLPEGTEVLARYSCPDVPKVHKQPSVWSYKANPSSGRVVMEGSHPEEVSSGERRDLTAAMILYALDGRGLVSVKGFLKNGEKRVMDKMSSDGQPEYARIGDMQCHHFAVFIPSGAVNVRFEVEGSEDADLVLRLNRQTYAFPSNAEYVTERAGNMQSLSFPSFDFGVTYVSVQCMNKPSVENTDYGQEYSGQTEVLNGLPYVIKVSWDNN